MCGVALVLRLGQRWRWRSVCLQRRAVAARVALALAVAVVVVVIDGCSILSALSQCPGVAVECDVSHFQGWLACL